MEEKKNTVGIFFHHVFVIFGMSIIGLTVNGWLYSRDFFGYFTEGFAMGRDGLPYESIAQFLGLSVVMALLVTLLTEDIVLKKVMLLWRIALLLVLCIISCITFAAVFGWFPTDYWQPWAVFIALFTVLFLIGFSGMYVKTKVEDKKYEELLSDYKRKQNKEDIS